MLTVSSSFFFCGPQVYRWVNIFEQLFQMAAPCMEFHFTQLWVNCYFWAQTVHEVVLRATRLRRIGGYLITALPEIYCYARRWKNFKNRSAFGKVRGKSRLALFSGHGVHANMNGQTVEISEFYIDLHAARHINHGSRRQPCDIIGIVGKYRLCRSAIV